MPKVNPVKGKRYGSKERHAPLGQEMQEDENRGKYASMKKHTSAARAVSKGKSAKEEEEDISMLDEKTSRRILALSHEQLTEFALEEQEDRMRSTKKNPSYADQRTRKLDEDSEDEEEDNDEHESSEHEEENVDDHDWIEHDQGYVRVVENAPELSAEEEALVATMMGNVKSSTNISPKRSLADMILEKIQEKEMKQQTNNHTEDQQLLQSNLPPKVIQVYTDIGKILSRYTAGKLPKAFKVIPSLSNWEEVLYLTRPDLWTPQAMFAATRIFASNLNPKMAQRFYNLVLLDSVRADIVANHKLNYHYYMALKKAVYKPAAFFKGILLPLCKEDCTLREAAIVASALQRVSIPVHHSAVAIHKLAQMDTYNGASSIFIKTLLNKKYSLPAPVIGSLIHHFASFVNDSSILPVLWHQCLLTFIQRYRNEVNDEGKQLLKQVMKVHFHPKITPEIRRELFGSQAWKEERGQVGSITVEGSVMDYE